MTNSHVKQDYLVQQSAFVVVGSCTQGVREGLISQLPEDIN